MKQQPANKLLSLFSSRPVIPTVPKPSSSLRASHEIPKLVLTSVLSSTTAVTPSSSSSSSSSSAVDKTSSKSNDIKRAPGIGSSNGSGSGSGSSSKSTTTVSKDMPTASKETSKHTKETKAATTTAAATMKTMPEKNGGLKSTGTEPSTKKQQKDAPLAVASKPTPAFLAPAAPTKMETGKKVEPVKSTPTPAKASSTSSKTSTVPPTPPSAPTLSSAQHKAPDIKSSSARDNKAPAAKTTAPNAPHKLSDAKGSTSTTTTVAKSAMTSTNPSASSKDAKDAKDAKDTKDSKDSKDAKDAKDATAKLVNKEKGSKDDDGKGKSVKIDGNAKEGVTNAKERKDTTGKSNAHMVDCPIWTPWKWDLFAPRSRVYSGKAPQHKIKPGQITDVPPTAAEAVNMPPPNKWAFEFQERLGRAAAALTNDAQAAACYNVFLTVACAPASTATTDDDTLWCRFLRAQMSPVLAVCAMIISREHPRGQYRRFIPNSAIKTKDADHEPLTALLPLLRGANTIYTADVKQVYGLLRASPQDVVDLRDFAHVSNYTNIDTVPDPLRPEPTHFWYGEEPLMNPDMRFDRPTAKDAYEITRPTVQILPDPTWSSVDVKDVFEASQNTVMIESGDFGSTRNPFDDMDDEKVQRPDPFDALGKEWPPSGLDFRSLAPIHVPDPTPAQCAAVHAEQGMTLLNATTSWTPAIKKPVTDGYIASDMLAMLGPRTVSLARDLHLARLSSRSPSRLLTALWRWNEEWWNAQRRARDALPDVWMSTETRRLVTTDDQFVAWAKHNRLRVVCGALMHEAATLADICTAVYSRKQRVTVEHRANRDHASSSSSSSSSASASSSGYLTAQVTMSTFGVVVVNKQPGRPPTTARSRA